MKDLTMAELLRNSCNELSEQVEKLVIEWQEKYELKINILSVYQKIDSRANLKVKVILNDMEF